MNSRNPYSFLSCRIKREAGTHTKAEVIVMSKASVYFTLTSDETSIYIINWRKLKWQELL